MGIFDIFKRKKTDTTIEIHDETPVIEENTENLEKTDTDIVSNTVDTDIKEEVPETDVVNEKQNEMTYETLSEQYEKANADYRLIWDSCAREGLPYAEMLYRTTDIRNRLTMLSRQLRLIQTPKIKYPKETDGQRYKMPEFISMCLNNEITDSDGFGLYAARKGVSDIKIYPSDIIENSYREDFTHVLWINKKNE